ncbi:MAG: hypothetical protein GOV15_02965 [Candidatus Diapherotrites archaeon]|nr:hypothetical protein [Candidatus Diapherotrites archaeon]
MAELPRIKEGSPLHKIVKAFVQRPGKEHTVKSLSRTTKVSINSLRRTLNKDLVDHLKKGRIKGEKAKGGAPLFYLMTEEKAKEFREHLNVLFPSEVKKQQAPVKEESEPVEEHKLPKPRKGSVLQHVMTVLANNPEKGLKTQNFKEELTEGDSQGSAIYQALNKLEEQGHITSKSAGQTSYGKPKKKYFITKQKAKEISRHLGLPRITTELYGFGEGDFEALGSVSKLPAEIHEKFMKKGEVIIFSRQHAGDVVERLRDKVRDKSITDQEKEELENLTGLLEKDFFVGAGLNAARIVLPTKKIGKHSWLRHVYDLAEEKGASFGLYSKTKQIIAQELNL